VFLTEKAFFQLRAFFFSEKVKSRSKPETAMLTGAK
jgi:hypothetical protein